MSYILLCLSRLWCLFVAQIMAQQLQSQMGQSVIVENRPAANGTIATEAVARATPDGHTLLITSASIAVNPNIYRNLPYNVLTDLEVITAICQTERLYPGGESFSFCQVGAGTRGVGGRSKQQTVIWLPGVGNTLHLAGELFKMRAGIDLTHVPYRGAGAAITDLLGGQIQVMFVTAPLSLAHIQSGKLRPLAYTATDRWSVLPELPTMAEAGIQNFVMDGGWYGMFGPAGPQQRSLIVWISR